MGQISMLLPLLSSIFIKASGSRTTLTACEDFDGACTLIQEQLTLSVSNPTLCQQIDCVSCQKSYQNLGPTFWPSLVLVQVQAAHDMCASGLDHYCPVSCNVCPSPRTCKDLHAKCTLIKEVLDAITTDPETCAAQGSFEARAHGLVGLPCRASKHRRK